MKYFYEYKKTNGCKVGGHNLEEIKINENNILLIGIDKIRVEAEIYEEKWHSYIDMNEIEYLKIEPMKEEVEE